MPRKVPRAYNCSDTAVAAFAGRGGSWAPERGLAPLGDGKRNLGSCFAVLGRVGASAESGRPSTPKQEAGGGLSRMKFPKVMQL